MSTKAILLAAVAGAWLALAAHGADIYRWTDESGRVHLSDDVPAKYKGRAVRIDSRQFEQTPEQRRQAEARLARDRKALAASGPGTSGAAGAGAIRPGSAASAPELECETLHREYRESLDCFAPFVNGNGTLKPNAFAACRSVVDPSPRCGPVKAN